MKARIQIEINGCPLSASTQLTYLPFSILLTHTIVGADQTLYLHYVAEAGEIKETNGLDLPDNEAY